jgi:aminoglycoside N3'-acetyltransferase
MGLRPMLFSGHGPNAGQTVDTMAADLRRTGTADAGATVLVHSSLSALRVG